MLILGFLRTILLCLSVLWLGPPSGWGAPFPHTPIFPTVSSLQPYVHLIARKGKKSSSRSPKIVKNLRFHKHPTYSRLVLDLPSRPQVSEKRKKKAKTVQVQLSKTILSKKARKKLKWKTFPKGVSISVSKKQVLSLTIDLKVFDRYQLQTLTRPHRLVLDLFPKSTPQPPKVVKKKKGSVKKEQKPKRVVQKKEVSPTKKKSAPPTQTTITPPPDTPRTKQAKDLLVVLDPGHGGKDPGAIGKKGTQEKRITLQIAKKLKRIISKRLGAHVLLTREKDNFVNLEKRVELANTQKADLFISIHVNSHPQKKIKGLELYHFGKASDPRALEVAARENGTPLEDDSPDWQFILADKIIDQKIEDSRDFAWTTRKSIMAKLQKHYRKVKDHGVKTAPFYVLRFTTMPGILAEVAFVSNPTEEKRIRTSEFQSRMAEGIFDGIQIYLKSHYPSISS
ncbi:MAG: N-acetylmuramoyl-L-alanine amidase [Nitrospirae bacterium]|nr:N-acetylmuramoyl-L-alanine amidase [Nitrospirota bacterium]